MSGPYAEAHKGIGRAAAVLSGESITDDLLPGPSRVHRPAATASWDVPSHDGSALSVTVVTWHDARLGQVIEIRQPDAKPVRLLSAQPNTLITALRAAKLWKDEK